MARLRDFDYMIYDNPRQDPRGGGILVTGVATFNIQGDREDNDFFDALEDFKAQVPAALRQWDPSIKEWTVIMTADTKDALCDIFENAEGLIEEAEAQLTLPFEE